MLALSSNLDENKVKVSEKSHEIISLVSYQLAAPFRPLQTGDQTHLNDARLHRVAKGTAELMYTALLSSQVVTACLHVSDCSSHESRIALENLRNELRSDLVSALARLLSVQGLRLRDGAYSTA